MGVECGKYSYETVHNTYEVWRTLPRCYTKRESSGARVGVHAEGLNAIEGLSVDVANVDTNMVRAILKPTVSRVK